MLENLVGTPNWLAPEFAIEKKIQEVLSERVEKISAPTFRIGDRVFHATRELGLGVVFKIAGEGQYWVAWGEREDRLSSVPCLIDLYNGSMLVLNVEIGEN